MSLRGALIALSLPVLATLTPSSGLWADEVRIAVASNFSTAAQTLAAAFEARTEHDVTLVMGSTGKHFAQISNGAPFELFLAADGHHPKRLEDEGLALPGSRFTYAFGRLVLWSPRQGYVDSRGDVLAGGDYRFLAIANPSLAPYGRAAREVLTRLGLWASLQRRMVRGENIGQAFQFVATGNAELGFVALSQVSAPATVSGSLWKIPQDLYSPIEQQAVLLKESDAAWAFVDFVRSEQARRVIREHGYRVP